MPRGAYKHTLEHRIQTGVINKRIGLIPPRKVGKKNNNWKGGKYLYKSTYNSVHQWLARWYGKSDTCEECKVTGLSGRKIHWANISKEYKRHRNDWIRLCAKCHYAFDRGTRTGHLTLPYLK